MPAPTMTTSARVRIAPSHDQAFKLLLQPVLPHLANLERQAQHAGRPLGGVLQLWAAVLRQPDHAAVVAEVVAEQLRMAVEPERAPHRALEAAGQEVGQEVGARLLRHRLLHLAATEDVVAVLAAETGTATPVELTVEPAEAAAVGIGDGGRALAEPVERGGHRRRDPLGPVVKLRRQRMDLDVPAAPPGDGVDVERERAAGDDPCGHPGNASSSMNLSLKSSRPESSTYSTSSRIASAAARSR